MVPFGEYIGIFSPSHMIYIIGLIFFAALLLRGRHHIKQNRDRLTLIILIVSIIQQILLYSAYFYLLDFDLAESLPFHISRINTILGIVYLITKNEKLFSVMSYLSLYAWTSFLYPSRVYGFNHPLGLSFFINHVVTLLLPFYAMLAYDVRLVKKDRNKAFVWFIIYLAGVLIINPLLDGNYFYLKHKPFLAFLPDSIYILIVLAVTYLLFYLGGLVYFAFQRLIEERTVVQTKS